MPQSQTLPIDRPLGDRQAAKFVSISDHYQIMYEISQTYCYSIWRQMLWTCVHGPHMKLNNSPE